MAINVICGNDIATNYSVGTQTISLSAIATGATVFRWTLLSAPQNSTASTSVRGSFTNGTATVQNPSFVTDAGLEGSYVFQCVASSATETSNSGTDGLNGQQVVTVRTQRFGCKLPNNYQYDWAAFHNYNLSTFESQIPTTLADLNTLLGSDCDDVSDSRPLAGHAINSPVYHSASTVAQLSSKISDATLDLTTSGRPPSGSAGGDLSGTYPSSVTVSKIHSVVVNPSAGSGDALTYNSSSAQWERGTVPSGLLQLPVGVAVSGYNNSQGKLLAVSSDEDAVLAIPVTDVQEIWPRFSSDADDTSDNVYASSDPFYGSKTRLILNDGNIYTTYGMLTCNANSSGLGGVDAAQAPLSSTGLLHIYAVPNGSAFALVMSTTNPTIGGPPSYPIYKYLWTVEVNATSPAQIYSFLQWGSFYKVKNHQNGGHEISTIASPDYKPSSSFPYQDWYRFNGSDAWPANLGGNTLSDIRLKVPTSFCYDVQLQVHVYTYQGYIYGGTYVAGRILPQIMGGNLTSPADDTWPGWTNMPVQAYTSYTTGTPDRQAGRHWVRLVDEMMAIRLFDCRGEDLSCRVCLRAYKNGLYGR